MFTGVCVYELPTPAPVHWFHPVAGSSVCGPLLGYRVAPDVSSTHDAKVDTYGHNYVLDPSFSHW